ncbi:hypothetical protein R84B8_01872 [Treponema sp. R8-4-B8]
MKKFVCVIAVLTALLAIFACVSGGSSQKKREPDVKVAVFPQVGHTDEINSVAFSPDGKTIVSCSSDTSLKLWDTETGREIKTFNGHTWQVLVAVFSPSGKYILSGSNDKTLKLWDVESGRDIKTFSGHSRPVTSLAISPDEKFVLSSSDDDTIKLWDVKTGKEIKTFSGYKGKSLTFSPDSRHILLCLNDGYIEILDAATGKERKTFKVTDKIANFAVFSPDGKYILYGSYILVEKGNVQNFQRNEGKQNTMMYNVDLKVLSIEQPMLKLLDTATGQEVKTFLGHTGTITSAAFSFDGQFIISGSVDKTVKLWNVETGEEIKTFSGYNASVTSVAFSPDEKTIFSSSGSNTIKFWNAVTGNEIKTSTGFTGFAGPTFAIAYSPDNSMILSNTNDFTLRLWDAKTGIPIRTFSGHTAFIRSAAFSPDEKTIVSLSNDETLRLWDVETGQEIKCISTGRSGNVRFSPDGKRILVRSIENDFLLLDTETGKVIRKFLLLNSGYIFSTVFSPDGKYILSGSSNKTIKLWEAETGEEIRNYLGHTGQVMSAVFSPDGKQILSGSDDGTVRLWNTETGQEINRFSENLEYVLSVAFSPDGKYILSDSASNTLYLRDVKTGKTVKSFSGHTSMVFSIVFSSDGKQILSGSYDGTVRLWDVATGKEIAQFISFIGGEWIVITPEGYYNASPNGDNYLNVRINNNVYGIDQFRKIFYRPEIVATALSSNAAAYQAMVKKAGANIKNAMPPPKVTIEPVKSTEAIKTEQTKITVTINDDNLEIKNVWINVNGRQVAGKSVSRAIVMPASGLNVTGKDKKMYFTIPLDVEDGNNVVEVFASNGYAEGRDTISFNAEIRQALPDLWMIAIGVNDYSSPLVSDLAYAVNDAKELADVFKRQEVKRYAKVNTLVIADGERQKPTAAVIRESFTWFKQAKERDLCILFIAGHAVNDSGGNYFFLPADAAFDESGNIDTKTAISHIEINSVLDMPGRKLFILDTCHSAGAGKSGIADTNSFIRQAMEYYPVIFSSSRGSELSQERPEYKHGIFTYGIIKGIEGAAVSASSGTVTMKSLDSYVSEVVSEMSGGRQNPTTITPNGYVNFVLAGAQKK